MSPDRRFRINGHRTLIAAASIAVAIVVTASAVALGPSALAADVSNQPAGCSEPNRRMTLHAEELPSSSKERVRLGWASERGTATSPGPLIEMVEGDCLAITVVNDIPASTLQALRRDPSHPLGVSLHVHGVKYTTSSDGTLSNTPSFVPPGGSRTYIWYAAPRVVTAGRVTSLGTAGTWWYHDHVVGTSHGTEGVAAGLAGGLVVRRPSDLANKPDKTYTVVMGPRHEINFGLPTPFTATEGELVEFVVIGAGNNFHTFHLHGHNWADTRTGLADPLSDVPLIDAKTVGPSESFGFQVKAGESVGAGDWMLHCHVQDHSDLGMSTDFVVEAAGGAAPAGAVDALDPLDPHAPELTHSH